MNSIGPRKLTSWRFHNRYQDRSKTFPTGIHFEYITHCNFEHTCNIEVYCIQGLLNRS